MDETAIPSMESVPGDGNVSRVVSSGVARGTLAALAVTKASDGKVIGGMSSEASAAAVAKHSKDLMEIRDAMNPERLDAAVSEHTYVLLAPPPAAGKSYAIKQYIASQLCRDRFQVVVYFVPSHKLAHEIQNDLNDLGISVYRYPPIDEAACAGTERFTVINEFRDLCLGSVAEAQFCRDNCDKSGDCRYFKRIKNRAVPRRYRVVVAPSSVLRVRPNIVSIWSDGRSVLTIMDDCMEHVEQFIQTFKTKDIEVITEVMKSAGLERYEVMFRDFATKGTPPTDLHLTNAVWMEIQQSASRLGVSLAKFESMCLYSQRGLWEDDGEYAVRRTPLWVGGVIIAGAFLNAGFIAPRLGLSHLHPLVDVKPLLHPGSHVVQITGMQGSASYWKGNRGIMARLAADIIQECQRHGLTIALQTRKDAEDLKNPQLRQLTTSAVANELRRRGDVRTMIGVEPDAKAPDPFRVPVVIYGAIGLNAFEECDVLLSLMAYHVDGSAVGDIAYGSTAPSKRPDVTIGKGRRLKAPSGVDFQQIAEAYFLAEPSVILQAIARVRFTSRARVVVFFCPHNLKGHLERTTTVALPAAVRGCLRVPNMSLADQGRDLQKQKDLVVQLYKASKSAATVAGIVGVSEKTILRWLEEAEVERRCGRPVGS